MSERVLEDIRRPRRPRSVRPAALRVNGAADQILAPVNGRTRPVMSPGGEATRDPMTLSAVLTDLPPDPDFTNDPKAFTGLHRQRYPTDRTIDNGP